MSGSRLDPWVDSYASRAHAMRASEIRALFAVASRPEVVSLAGGMPFVQALPIDMLLETAQRVLRERGAQALQYGSGQGDVTLREQILQVIGEVGVTAHPDDIIVTTGSQMALDLVTRVFCDPGDVVLVESPSYVGALGVFRAYECDVVHVAMDDEGLVPSALDEAIVAVRAAGKRAKLIYTIPNVVYLGTFSKTIAAGLRVGWAVAPHGVREKLVLANEAAVLCPSNYAQLTISEYLATQPWREQIKTFQEVYRERRDALLESLQALMPEGTTWTIPAGGFYSWLTLPHGLDATAMLPRAVASLVAYVPGTGFYVDGQGRQNLRLSYCYPEPDRIREGVRRLAGVIESELELAETFGTTHSRGAFTGSSVPAPDLR